MPKVYAVKVGRKPGIYHSWDTCSSQVHQFPQSEFKSFASIKDAEAYLKAPARSGQAIPQSLRTTTTTQTDSEQESIQQPQSKKPCIDSSVSIHPSTATSTATTKLLSIDQLPVDSTPQIQGITQRLTIYTDGACGGNGKRNARGGIGVFFGEGDTRNISEPLPGPVQTNNRAELL
ncbi:UNVERIFIED_CONTAM: Ribonuclease H1, partial [Siphonaria sp. JEL0065]